MQARGLKKQGLTLVDAARPLDQPLFFNRLVAPGRLRLRALVAADVVAGQMSCR
jgi:hypothetical protein